jgi:tRNA (guanine37-N1)-methyltransferase
MKFDIVTIFPNIFSSYFNESILKRAQATKKVHIKTHDIRAFATNKHNTVDDTPYGGGAGMILMAEPILKAVEKIMKPIRRAQGKKSKVIILSAKGKLFTQKMAERFAKQYDQLILISGRYEGIDERVKVALKAEEISIGPYVLTDGDVAVMNVVSAVTRLIPGVIKNASLEEESRAGETLEYPHYTKPEVIVRNKKKYRVPKVLLSGNHKKIEAWRKGKMK